ncbi:hypothetical protein Barb6_02383 [Bacteroidales bacterium Barb6]|nr:hypothetical protein Barb6_02383 [Bacteroidales bacterium Barb6]
MITRIRHRFRRCHITIQIRTAARLYPPVFTYRHLHLVTVSVKMRLNPCPACHNKRVGIFPGNNTVRFVCPPLKMIARIGGSLCCCFRIMRIHTAARPYRSVIAGRHTHLIAAYGK